MKKAGVLYVEKFTVLRNTMLRRIRVLPALLLGLGITAGAQAKILEQEGCIEWQQNLGCIVRQYCTLNTDTRYWACIDWDSRNGTIAQTSGYY